ncbi:MAG: cytochrome c biogenesis protein CcdA [Polyangiaceae bacterium]
MFSKVMDPKFVRREAVGRTARFGFLSGVLALTLLSTWSAPSSAATLGTDSFSRALSQGPFAAAFAAFLGGLLVSLTPCVYPMVAVTVSVFGAKETKSRWQGLGLTSAFVFGMIVMFVSLGLVAAFTGTMFGSVLQNRWVVLGIAVLFAAMALSMFGAFELTLPSGLLNRLATVGGIGFRGAFVLGLVSGLVASPCTGPVLTGILAWIATTKNLVLGSVAMTFFALGLGVPFFAVGAFALELPKSGRWMLSVKYVLGTVLLVVALYFAGTTLPMLPSLVPTGHAGWLLGAALVSLGCVLALVLRRSSGSVRSLFSVIAIASFVAGGFVTTTKLSRTESTLSWEHGPLESAMERGRRDGRPMLVDFTATWCGACKELDKLTFSDAAVKLEAGRFLAVKVDATHDDDPKVASAMQRLSVRGLPTVVLIDANGKEVRRFTDFVAKGPFLDALRTVH